MASSKPLKDIDEQFLQCLICLDRLEEPKLLPCLHRYCRDCLHRTVKKQDTKLRCPTCREEHDLPKDGVDSFKTDFNTKNIVEFVQLQESIEQEPLKVCAGCTKELKVTGYCFRCNDFLCQGCHEYHKTIKILKDHRDHIFSLSEAKTRNLTIEKLSSLKEAPRCSNHPTKLSELCCITCDNVPICMACTYGAHKGHDLQEVATLAKIERVKLTEKLTDVLKYKEKIYKRKEEIKNTKEKLNRTIDEKQMKLQEEFDAEEQKIKRETSEVDVRLKELTTELEEKWKGRASFRKQELEKIIQRARAKYDKVCEEEKQEADAEFRKLQEGSERDKAKLNEGLNTINQEIKKLLTSLKTQEEENNKKINELSNHFDDIVTRFENLITTASSILAAKHDWIDVQCIPDICTAIDPLIEEAMKEYPELEVLSGITVGSIPSVIQDSVRVHITEREESVVDIEGKNYSTLPINTITSTKNGSIVITGWDTSYNSNITVIDITGKQLRQDKIKSTNTAPYPYCSSLSQFNIATIRRPNEVGVYDIRDGTYRKTEIPDIISNWPVGQEVSCVATDPGNDHIIVGAFRSRDLFVFNSELKHIYTLALPEVIQWCREITIHGGNFLVCDYDGRKAYAVAAEGLACKLMYEFATPDIDGGDWKPRSVCTDKKGFIYMLWKATISQQNRGIVVQYDKGGGRLLTRSLDQKYSADCITLTTMETEAGEKLLIPTKSNFIMYGLVKKKR